MAITGSFNAKEMRDHLISKQALSDQSKERAAITSARTKELLSQISEEHIQKLETYGVPIRSLLSYDMNLVYTDKETHQKFIAEFTSVLRSIEEFLTRESGVE